MERVSTRRSTRPNYPLREIPLIRDSNVRFVGTLGRKNKGEGAKRGTNVGMESNDFCISLGWMVCHAPNHRSRETFLSGGEEKWREWRKGGE